MKHSEPLRPDYRRMSVGDPAPPAAAGPAYFSGEIEPRWHCVVTAPGTIAHADCRAFIRDAGMFAFFPSEERSRSRRGRTYITEVPMVPGYVFAQFLRDPMWHLWPNHKWFLRVFKIGERPYNFAYAQIRHLQGLTVDAERLRSANAAMEAEIAAASRPVANAPAAIVAGPLSGNTVRVDAIDGDDAVFELFGMKVRASLSSMRRT